MQQPTDTAASNLLARKAGVPYGAHAFIVRVTFPDGFQDAWGNVRAEEGVDATQARAQAQLISDQYLKRHPEKTFDLVEVGKPVDAPAIPPALSRAYGLIESMKGLIEEAMATHIYDFDNGDTVDPGCGYQAAVNAADAFLEENHLAKPEPVNIGIHLDGGLVQNIWSDKRLRDITITVIDYDTEGGDVEDLVRVKQDNGGYADAFVSTWGTDCEVAPMPLICNPGEEQE